MPDLILFRFAGVAMHVAVVIKPGVMLHAHAGAEATVIEPWGSSKWRHRNAGFFRHEAMP